MIFGLGRTVIFSGLGTPGPIARSGGAQYYIIKPNTKTRMKTKLLTLIGACAASVLAVQAQTSPAPAVVEPAPTVAVTLTPTLVSHYMFRGQLLGGLSFQPAVEASFGSAVAGVWSNFPIKDEVPGVSDPEFDLYASNTFTLSDAANFVVGFTYYYYPKSDLNAGFYRATFEPSVAFNYTYQGIKVTPKVYWDFTLDGPTYELAAAYALPLKDLGTELDFTAVGGTYLLKDVTRDAAPQSKAWGDYWLVGVSSPFQLSKNSKLTVGFAYTKGSNAFTKQGTFPKTANGAAVGRGVVSLSYALTF